MIFGYDIEVNNDAVSSGWGRRRRPADTIKSVATHVVRLTTDPASIPESAQVCCSGESDQEIRAQLDSQALQDTRYGVLQPQTSFCCFVNANKIAVMPMPVYCGGEFWGSDDCLRVAQAYQGLPILVQCSSRPESCREVVSGVIAQRYQKSWFLMLRWDPQDAQKIERRQQQRRQGTKRPVDQVFDYELVPQVEAVCNAALAVLEQVCYKRYRNGVAVQTQVIRLPLRGTWRSHRRPDITAHPRELLNWLREPQWRLLAPGLRRALARDPEVRAQAQRFMKSEDKFREVIYNRMQLAPYQKQVWDQWFRVLKPWARKPRVKKTQKASE